MLATEILTTDHREAISLIEELENAAAGSTMYKATFEQLKSALFLHMREEEEIYYPALEADEQFEGLIEENVPEHQMVRAMLAQLSQVDPSQDVFQETLAELKAALELHMTREEDEIFPESIDVLGEDRIEEIGNRIEQLKGESAASRSASM